MVRGDAKVFMFDEPTTGVDVGAKVEIYHQMTELARDGAGVFSSHPTSKSCSGCVTGSRS